jgi:hypothetical protein
MDSFIAANKARIKARHYMRQATASNHWFDFTSARVGQLERRHGDNFCLVVNGSTESDDAYVLPYGVIKSVLKPQYLDDRGRWVGTIIDGHLKLGKAEHSVPVAAYHNAFDLLK